MNMIIAAAQTIPKANNINQNLDDHYRLINLAADYGVRLIVFPEMSITGYERKKAESLSFTVNDVRLGKFRELATEQNIIIIAGAPLLLGSELFISSFIFLPDGHELIYQKQHLHEGEEIYFSSGHEDNLQIYSGGDTFSMAICADITNPSHAVKAAALNSDFYLASIFYTPNGILEGYQTLAGYAKELTLNVLMSNFCGDSYGLESAGKSAFWDNKGNLVGCFEGEGEGLLIVERTNDSWRTDTVRTPGL